MSDLTADVDELNRFTRTIWGNPRALVKRLPQQDVEFIDLGDFADAFRDLTGLILANGKILIRDEYRSALQALLTDRYEPGAYIIGQPGIGKTYFLIYLLVHFLGNKQAVALQSLSSTEAYVLFRDTATVHPLSTHAPLRQCEFVWALCDSNADMPTPHHVFKANPKRIRIVQVTSPQESHYKHWSKQMHVKPYIMDIWTEEEIESLATLLGKDRERMVSLARRWGAVPQTILDCMDVEDGKIEGRYRDRCQMAIEKCPQIKGAQLDLDGLLEFYFYRPMKLDTGDVDRERHQISVPTRTLRDLLGQGLVGEDNSVRIQFYRVLNSVPGTRQAVGQLYESWFHHFFTSATNPRIQCQWVKQGLNDNVSQLPLALRGDPLIRSTREGLKDRTPPYYWVPPRSDFPGVDSILVLEGRAFAFQVAIGWRHTSPLGGLQALGEWSPELKKLEWRVIFIGPEQEPIQQVAMSWANRVRFPTNEKLVPIAWSVVDPVHPGIDYEPYDNEPDEDTGEAEG